MTTTNPTSDINPKIATFVEATNKAFSALRTGSSTLFQSFVEASKNLNNRDYVEYKNQLECDSSTINKLDRITRCGLVMDNLERLPASWSTLYAITVKVEDKKFGKENSEMLVSFLDAGVINTKTPKKNLMKTFAKPVKKGASTFLEGVGLSKKPSKEIPVVNKVLAHTGTIQDVYQLDEKTSARVCMLVKELESLGFSVFKQPPLRSKKKAPKAKTTKPVAKIAKGLKDSAAQTQLPKAA